MTLTREEQIALVDPASYHRHGYPWKIWEKLRREDPVCRVESANGEVYWAVTRYQDIMSVEGRPEIFENGPKLTIGVEAQQGLRMIVGMDPPDHTAHRALAKSYFMPRNIEWVRTFAEEIVTQAFDQAMARNGEVLDLQDDFANLVPTAVISAFLGAPRETWPQISELTNTIINANDPRVYGDQSVMQTTGQAVMQMCGLYAGVFENRRADPRDDFPTALVQATINGEPMGQNELFSWAIILMTAGHETTQSTFGAIVDLMMRQPDLLERLRGDPALLGPAIEEFLRYVSPAVHFIRTPNRDVEVAGKSIPAGEHLVMFYPSANRDAAVFERPDELILDRSPNRHLAFGTGPHMCLGMHLARLELKIMIEQFLQRVERIEPAGDPERVFGIATGGYKHIPVRMTVRPAV